MAGYVFSLRSVLSFRKSRRDLCRQLLGQVLADDGQLVNRRQTLMASRERQFDEIRKIGARGRVSVDGAAMRRYHSGQLLAQIHAVDQRREIVAGQIQLCRNALTRADADVKVLERLESKQRAAYLESAEHIAQREREDAWSVRRHLEAAR